MDPTVYGDYPEVMKNSIGKRLPSFTTAQSKKLRGSFDFVGVNYYSAFYVKSIPEVDHNTPNWRSDARIEWRSKYTFFIILYRALFNSWLTSNLGFTSFLRLCLTSFISIGTEQNKAGQTLGVRGGSEWDFLYPQGLRKFLNYAKNKYESPKFMITENGNTFY